jgi:hypothetical protein
VVLIMEHPEGRWLAGILADLREAPGSRAGLTEAFSMLVPG